MQKIYKYDYRMGMVTCYLWGWDNQNNPSFMVLYGGVDYPQYNSATFTDCAIFRGADGHFPRFENVRISNRYDHSTRARKREMFYVKDLSYTGYSYYPRGNSVPIKAFYSLDNPSSNFFSKFFSKPKLTINENAAYTDLIHMVGSTEVAGSLEVENFKLAKSPSEVLGLSAELSQYEQTLCELLTNPNLYSRKKKLKELVNSMPPTELYHHIMKIGSDELVSGLFLELAKQKNPILAEEAVRLLTTDETTISRKHRTGILRCAYIYYVAISEERAEQEIQQLLDSSQQWIQVYYNPQDVIEFKNKLQMVDILSVPSVLARTAFALDTKKVLFPTNYSKPVEYFSRYSRRMLDELSTTDEAKFMEAMVELFSSYTQTDMPASYRIWDYDIGDYITVPGRTYFINHYLYHIRYGNFAEYDKKYADKKRFEFKPEIWDRHLDKVLFLAGVTKVEMIAEPLHHILIDNFHHLISFPYEKLLAVAESPYAPLAEMIVKIIVGKLKMESNINLDLLVLLAQSRNKDIQKLVLDYFSNVEISPENAVLFMYMQDWEESATMLADIIEKFDINGYMAFLHSVLDSSEKFATQNIIWSDKLIELIDNSLTRIEAASFEQKSNLVQKAMASLGGQPDYIANLSENIIFNMPLIELRDVLTKCSLPVGSRTYSLRLLGLIKTNDMPDVGLVVTILEDASPKVLNILVEILLEQKQQLSMMHLILLLESEVESLNSLAKDVFGNMPNYEKYKLHSKILDSPDKKTYQFGLEKLREIYLDGEIPPKFLIEMLEHPSPEVRIYASDKITQILNEFGSGNKDLFVYYAKTLLLLPNKASKGKKNIYALLPKFVDMYKDKQPAVEEFLLELGGSNIISDSEQALVALVKIRSGDF